MGHYFNLRQDQEAQEFELEAQEALFFPRFVLPNRKV